MSQRRHIQSGLIHDPEMFPVQRKLDSVETASALMELRAQWQLHLYQIMLFQCVNCLYSVLPICLPLLFALFSHFTASLPNLTVGLLIRRSVSQAVLSLCRNLHLLSVYLHLGGKKKPSLGWLALSSLPVLLFIYRDLSVSLLSRHCFMFLCTQQLKPHCSAAWPRYISTDRNVSHLLAWCELATFLLNRLFHTYCSSPPNAQSEGEG